MAKKVTVSINAVVAGIALIAVCIGIIVYQNSLQAELFQKYTDIKYKNNNTEANLVYVRNKLEKCTAEMPVAADAGG